MMGWKPRTLSAVLYAGIALCAGCVPIPATVALAPAVSGTLRHADGTPIAGQPLALATGYGDSTCARPALHTTSDSAGAFAFPAVRQRERFTVVLFERMFSYSICGGRRGTDPIYQSNFLHRVPELEHVSCVAAAPVDSVGDPRIRCAVAERRRRR